MEAIHAVIGRHMESFHRSYRKCLAQDSGIGGRIGLRFTISSEGTVNPATIAYSNTRCPALETMILAEARTMRFLMVEKGSMTVNYSLMLDKR